MLRRRKPASAFGADIATCAATLLEVEADAGVNLFAISAMKRPRPARMAAVITMLRMTPHSHLQVAGPISPRRLRGGDCGRPVKAAIFAKRMTEALTGQVPRGLTRRIGSAEAGSSGQG